MSSQTVHLSSEQNLARAKGPSSSPGDRNGNSVPCPRAPPSPEPRPRAPPSPEPRPRAPPSPESQRSLSSLSDGTSSPADVDMQELCLGRGSPDAPPVHAGPAFILYRSAAASATPPDSPAEGESSSGSGGASQRTSSDNNCSLSSGEMLMRRNSFCLQEDQALSVSLLEESAGSPALGPRSPALGLLPASLQDVRKEAAPEGPNSEGVARDTDSTDATHQPCWGATFILPDDLDLPSEDDLSGESASQPDGVPCGRAAAGGHPRSFLCDSAAAVSTPPEEGGRTFMLPASEDLDSAGPAQTSTPVQNVGNQTICFPALAESPYAGNAGSPAPRPAKDRRTPATSPRQRCVARLTPSSGGTGNAEIKRFPKPDFSNVRPKIATRPACPTGTASPALAQVYSPRASRANRSTPVSKRHPGARNNTPRLSTAGEGSRSSRLLGVAGEDAGAPGFDATFVQWDEQDLSPAAGRGAGTLSVTERGEGGASVFDGVPAASERGRAASEPDRGASSAAAAPCPDGQTFCFPSPAESASSKDQGEPGPAAANESPGKQEVLNQNGKRPGSTSNQDKPPAPARRSRFWSETGSSSRPIRETRESPTSSSSFTQPRADLQPGQTTPGQTTPGGQNRPSQNRPAKRPESSVVSPDGASRAVRKISLTTAPAAVGVGGAWCEGSKSRQGGRPLPSRVRAAPAASPGPRPSPGPSPSPGPRPGPPAPWQRQGTLGRDGCRVPGGMGPPRTKPTTTTTNSGRQRTRSTDGPSTAAPSTNGSAKPPVSGPRPPPIPGPATSHPSAPASRLPHRPQGPPRSTLSKASLHSEAPPVSGGPVSGGPAQSSVGRPGSSRTTAARTGHLVFPVRSTEPALTGRRTTAPAPSQPSSRSGPAPSQPSSRSGPAPSQPSSRSGAAPLKWSPSSRLARPTAALPVEKSRPKAGPPRSQPPPPPRSQPPPQDHGPTDPAPAEVLQRTLAERDEAVKQRRELSEEMVTLRGELVSSAHCCDRLEREKEEARAAMEEALRTAQEHHGSELARLEERLQAFYQAEWDKAHLACQQEADRCKAHMDQQMGELRANQEALRLELETRHALQLQEVQQQYDGSLEELREAHDQELQTVGRALEETEAMLSAQIQELTEENSALSQRLKAEEDRRRELAEKNQKDSHTLYLEQELDSLKVVLDIKNKQLHQQDKKLMQMDKLLEKSVKLDECLKRVQQENEDLRARMDRHCTLSRQLSTEQAVLQETLQKESKVNKRLSMENEELLWKLHNGDLASPRKMSPASPSHSLGLQSPRSPPVSPR